MAAYCYLLSHVSCLGACMVLTEEKRVRLANAIALRQGALGGVGASAPSAPIRETAMTQELSSLSQLEKDTKRQLFDKGQEAVQLQAKILPLHTRVIELEEQAEETKAKMAKLEERATNQEVQLGRVEGELVQQAETFKKTEAELIEEAADACVHPEMDTPPIATSNQVVDGQLVPRAPPSKFANFRLLMHNLYFHIYECLFAFNCFLDLGLLTAMSLSYFSLPLRLDR